MYVLDSLACKVHRNAEGLVHGNSISSSRNFFAGSFSELLVIAG